MVNLAMAIAIPLYIWPTSLNTWKPLYNAITSSPNTTFNIIINPDSGPSNGGTSPDIISAVTSLRTHSNVQLFGYVHVEYGQRNMTDVKRDIATYSTWKKTAKTDIHLDGIFLDEAPQDTKYLAYMQTLQTYIRTRMIIGTSSKPARAKVWTNPGIPIDAKFYQYADYVNAYENSYKDWSTAGGKSVIPECLRHKSTVMIYGYPAGAKEKLAADTKSVIAAGYNATFITTSSGYEEFSVDWQDYVRDVAALVKTTKVKTLPLCARSDDGLDC